MSTEEQARRHFLEEAETYFEQIETVILNLNVSEQRIQDLDVAMRAAHSVKGTAAMMGFMPLSHLAHRLEDFFKILRARNLALATEVETLLLEGLDGLRAVRQRLYDDQPIQDDWQSTQISPVFERLHYHLGDLTSEDETSLLSAESEVDVSVMVFTNGVEDYLDQLEKRRSHLTGDALRQELVAGASQLLDYGLMAEMDAFIELCQMVLDYGPRIVEEELLTFSDTVMQAWQRSHSLVLLGRIEQLPSSLDMSQFTLKLEDGSFYDAEEDIATMGHAYPADRDFPDISTNISTDISEEDISHLTAQLAQMDLESLDLPTFVEPVESTLEAETDSGPDPNPDGIPASNVELGANSRLDITTDLLPELDESELLALSEALDNLDLSDLPSELELDPSPPALEMPAPPPAAVVTPLLDPSIKGIADAINALLGQTQTSRLPITELTQRSDAIATDSSARPPTVGGETSVRVPVSQLHAINQLLSSLILDRNALNLRLEQLQTFTELLKQRVGEVESFNTQLRQWYDRASIDAIGQAIGAPGSDMSIEQGGDRDPSRISGLPTLTLSRTLTNAEKQTRTFDALEMDQYSNLHLLAQDQIETIVKLQEVAADIDLGLQEMGQASGRLNYTSRALQDQVSRTQMRPFEDIVSRFPRLIRDLSVQYGKQVNLSIEGNTTAFERSTLDCLTDPLIHLVRNAFDHGIESPEVRQQQGKTAEGQIRIRALNRGNRAVITISDDGKGIDLDKIRDRVRNYGIPDEQVQQMPRQELLSLIFEPGFSTAEHVTDLSGRGVGMDVVRTNLQPVKGDIQVDTTPGKGTTFKMTIPLSLSVARVMILEHQKMVFALTIDDVQEMIPFQPAEASALDHQDTIEWKERVIPLIQLDDYLEFQSIVRSVALDGTPTIDRPIVVIVGDEDNPCGLVLKRFWKEQDVVMQPIATPIPLPPGFSGATVLGDGRIIPLMDAQQLGTWVTAQQKTATDDNLYGRETSHPEAPNSSTPELLHPKTPELPTILVVDDSIHARRYLTTSLEKAGYLTEQAKDGQDAIDLLNAGLQVQAVICDVEMPRVDGYGVLDTLRNQPQFQALPILMLTSRSSDKHRKLAMNLGASAYFSKPYNEQELLQTLATFVHD